jgi:histidyl-tRNA synthetase
MQKYATNIASKLRQKGVPVEIDLSGNPLKKQMESASESKFVVIIAPKEFSSKSLILRNMQDGKEKQITVDDLLKNPKSILNL